MAISYETVNYAVEFNEYDVIAYQLTIMDTIVDTTSSLEVCYYPFI